MADYAFLHGGGQGGWVWRETIQALHAQAGNGPVHTLALDVPGCGAKRGRDTAATTMADVAAELVTDIEAAGMDDVVLVGHSQAGQAMPFMAHRRPGLFRRLVYVSCSMPLPGQSVLAMMGTGRHGERDDEVGWLPGSEGGRGTRADDRSFCTDMPPDEAARFKSALGRDSWPPATYAMTDWCHDGIGIVPASYVLCLRDTLLPPGWQARFAARLAADRVIRIDAGHQVMTTRPHALAEILRLEAVREDAG